MYKLITALSLILLFACTAPKGIQPNPGSPTRPIYEKPVDVQEPKDTTDTKPIHILPPFDSVREEINRYKLKPYIFAVKTKEDGKKYFSQIEEIDDSVIAISFAHGCKFCGDVSVTAGKNLEFTNIAYIKNPKSLSDEDVKKIAIRGSVVPNPSWESITFTPTYGGEVVWKLK